MKRGSIATGRNIYIAALLLSAALAAAVGCGTGQWKAEKIAVASGVELILKLSETVLTPGQTLQVKARVENKSGGELEYTMWNIGDPGIYLKVYTPFETIETLRADEERKIVLPAVTYGSLGAGETISREATWVVDEGDPNGVYTVEASFFPGRQDDESGLEPLAAAHDVEVRDSISVILSEHVYTAAAQNPSVQLWVRGHSGDAVARRMKNDYMVNVGGLWRAADEELYEQASNAAVPPELELDLESDPAMWLLEYSSIYGFPSEKMNVEMNAETGEVIDVAPDLAAELGGGVVATFSVNGSQFRAFVTNPDAIEQLYALQAGEIRANIPVSPLSRGPGAGMHNAPWSWHLDPEQFGLAEMTIEVCDGRPEFVEGELDYWLDQVGQYCPWSAELMDIEDYRN